jgi:hypothetical protein
VRYDYHHLYSDRVAFDASPVTSDERRLTFVTYVASRITFKANQVAYGAGRVAH